MEESKPVTRWQGWVRKPGFPWQKVDGTLSLTRGECYARLMELTELAGHMDLKQELAILPEEQYPPNQNTYHDRMMRPNR